MFKAIGLCAISFCATPAFAATVYDCEISSRNSKNVPERVIIEFDAATETATAMDGFVNHYVGKPIAARVVKNNEKRLTVSYKLDDIQAKYGGTILSDETRVTIIKASNEALVSNSQGYGATSNGNGVCTVSK